MLISKSHPNRDEAWVIAAIGLYMDRRSRTRGLLKRVIEPSAVLHCSLSKSIRAVRTPFSDHKLMVHKEATHMINRNLSEGRFESEQEWPMPCSSFWSYYTLAR